MITKLDTAEHTLEERSPGGAPSQRRNGLQAQLGYRSGSPNILQRGMQRVGSSRPGGWIFQRTLYRLDRPLYRWSHGRLTVPGVLAGLPVMIMTTTGARSGQPRTMPVAGIPFESDLAIIGSNYGQPRTPAWVVNLEANALATVRWRNRTADVRARPATDVESEEIWARATDIYAGFKTYRERITGRRVRIFVLEPVQSTSAPPRTAARHIE